MQPALPTNNTQSETLVDDFAQYSAACEALGGGIYHHPGWRRAFDFYGLKTHWLVAECAGKPVGLLPLVCQSSKLFGKRIVSLPWVDESGALGDDSTIFALIEHAKHLAQASGSGISLSVKQSINSQLSELPNGWHVDSAGKVLMRRRLAMSSEELWKDLSAKVRNQVRKGEKSNLVTEKGGAELVDAFYQIYSQNMRDLGSPSHSLRFFQTLVESLDGRANIYCTRLDGNVIGAGLVLDNCPSLDIPWASSLREYNRLCVNHSLYWKILSDACGAGYEWFHFGRSTIGSGQYKFKKQWGAQEAPLNWLIYSQNTGASGAENPALSGEKFGFAQKVWSKLPLWATRRLGPYIIRHVP